MVTNGLGKQAPLSLSWLEQDEYCSEDLCSYKNGSRKKKSKSAVKLSRPVTRSQKKMTVENIDSGNPALAPGRVTRSKKQKTVPNERSHLELQRGGQERNGHLPL